MLGRKMLDKTTTRIVQMSRTGTGSTFVVNLVAGLICPDEPICFPTRNWIHTSLLSKCHGGNPLQVMEEFSAFDLYLITSTRGEKTYKPEVLEHPRVLEIAYDDILETPDRPLKDVVETLSDAILDFLPPHIVPDHPRAELKVTALDRIVAMNRVVEQLSDKPFSIYDPFFHVHGSHRNRAEKQRRALGLDRLAEPPGRT